MEATCIPLTERRAQDLLQRIQALGDGCLQISSSDVEWFVYAQAGRAVYLSNSIEPFEQLSQVLRKCLQGTAINVQDLTLQARNHYEQACEAPLGTLPLAELGAEFNAHYQVLQWLKECGQLDDGLLGQITHQMSLEVLESLWLLPEEELKLRATPCQENRDSVLVLPPLNLLHLSKTVEERLKSWQKLQPEVYSPYQRPYLSGMPLQNHLSPELQARLRQTLIGFSLRQVATLLDQDDLALTEQLLPMIQQGVIKLHSPFSPFDRLPWKPQTPPTPPLGNAAAIAASPISSANSTTNKALYNAAQPVTESPRSRVEPLGKPPEKHSFASHAASTSSESRATKVWNIVCIDDSPAVLNEIKRFLQVDSFVVTLIDDSKKALMKINSIRPDIILLDANMPGVDGYQVCTMLRKSSALRHIPVIMVTGNRGLINRARAKIAGITDYLNKPFSQKDLLEIVFQHLSE